MLLLPSHNLGPSRLQELYEYVILKYLIKVNKINPLAPGYITFSWGWGQIAYLHSKQWTKDALQYTVQRLFYPFTY